MYSIHADEVIIGKNVVIEDGVVLQGRSSKLAKRIVIGDNSFIGENTKAYVDVLEIGEYTSIHNHSLISGDLPCRIGHSCWIGQNTILNSTGGLTIGNAVGIGAYSQLWSHIRHGDVLQGCRWNQSSPLIVEDDVWFVGHCIVSPIHARASSMALVGAVITQDMQPNRTYAGVPAKDVTEKVGPQFRDVPLSEKIEKMKAAYDDFFEMNPALDKTRIKIKQPDVDCPDLPGVTVFDVGTRTYSKKSSEEEFLFMKYLRHLQYKFFPSGSTLSSSSLSKA